MNNEFPLNFYGWFLNKILPVVLVILISLVSVQSVYAQALPDATQDFTGYSNMEDGTNRWVSPDNFFILNASRPNRINADQWGAFLSDSQSEGIEKTDWFDILVNPASELGGFEVEDIFIGEYDYGVNVARFQNVIVQGFQGETVVAETEPFTSQSDEEETRYPIDYSVFEGLQIDRFRITFTTNSQTPPDVFNLVEFTIKNASTEAPEPESDECSINSTVSSAEDLANDYMNFSQSFTACDDGKINSIKLLANADGSMYPESSVTMTFREGDGLSGTILKNVEIPTNVFNEASSIDDFITIDVSEHNILVSNGLQYTFGFEGDASNKVQIYYSDTSPVASIYSGGQLYAEGSAHADRDLIFKMEIGPASGSVAPTVLTESVLDINATSAIFAGYITDDGGDTVTERGFVFATSSNPTTLNTKVQSGSGTGEFSEEITGLDPETTYYVRAYAINGAGTSYGSEESFTTDAATNPPAFTSTPFTEAEYEKPYLYSISATLEGELSTTISALTLPEWLTFNSEGQAKATQIGDVMDLAYLGGVAGDDDGNVYAATTTGTHIFKIEPDGTTTLWVSGLPSGSVFAIHVAGDYLYIPRHNNPSETITRIALDDPGAGVEQFASFNGGAMSLTDHGDWIYAASYGSTEVKRIHKSNKTVETVLTSADGLPANGPFGLAFDDENNLYIATFSNNSVLKYDGIELTTAISGLPRSVSSVKTDARGNFYISMDSGGIRKYDSGWNDFTYISPGENDNIYSISFTNTGALVYALFYTNQVYSLQTGPILSGIPAKADVGDHPVVLEASNSAGSTQQSFTIGVQDNVPPVVESFAPAHNGTDVDRDPEFSITFDEEITLAETGVLNLHAGMDDTPFASFDLSVTDDRNRFEISEDERTLTFDYGTSFTAGTQITVTLSEGFVEDVHGNQFAGFDFASATWQFTIRDLIVQTIAFTEPDGKTWGDAEFQLGPSTSSEDLTVTYTAEDEDVLSIDGNMGTILKAGSTKVTATQAGNDDVAAADPVEQTVTIFKAELTVSVDEDQTKIYGEDDPAFTFEATGFVNDENEGIITGALDREEGEDSGTYDILNSDLSAGDNYTIDFKGSLFSITPAALTITAAENQSKTFGQIDPDFSFSASGFAFDDNADVLTGSLSREEGENAGNYAITQGNLDSENYTITFDPADFEITPAVLSVTADEDQSKTYGEADGALTFSTSGFAFDDDASILTGSLTRESGEEVGSYTIELGDLAAGSNYDLSFVSADLEITPRGLMIVADADQSKTYGEADPAFTFDATNFGWSDDKSVLTGALARDAGEDVGIYTINQGDLDAGSNYTIGFSDADFEIMSKALLVEANAGQTKVYGDADPALTFTATGFDLGDDENLIIGSLDRTSGEDAGSYEITLGNISAGDNYSIQFTVADFEITQRPLSLTNFTADGKTYDGSTDATGTGFDDDRVTGDEVTFDYDVAFSDENAGDSKDVLFTNIQIIGESDQNNYELQTADGVATADIAPRELTIVADGHSITYGEDDPNLTYQITSGELVTGDQLSGALERGAGQDVGTYTIQQGDLTAGDNYDITFQSADLGITPRELSVTVDADQSKTYGEADPAFTFDATNFGWSDDESVLAGTLSRDAGEDVGSYTINLGDLAAGGNYTIDFSGADFKITAKELIVEADAGQTKVYGETDPVFVYTATGFAAGDEENLFTGALDRAPGEDAGSYEIQSGDLSAGDNYAIQFATTDFEISARPLVLSDFVAHSKIYDGSTEATGTGFTDDRLANDDLEFSYDVAFSDESAGDEKDVLFTNLQISGGTDQNNYELQTSTGTASADISQLALTVAADGHSITYGEDDPALIYEITSGSLVSGDLLSGELDRNPGLDVGIYSIQQGDLTAGSNYDLSFVSADLEITPRELLIVAAEYQSKTYGEADPSFSFEADNFGWSDDESVLTGALARHGGEDVDIYTINQGDLAAGGNYTIDFSGADFEITAKELIVEADAGQTKVYGESDPALTFKASGFELGDDEQILSGSLNRQPGENTGLYEIKSGDLSAGDNYAIQFTTADFEISARPLVLSDFVAHSKIYDGSTEATGTRFTDDRLANDDLEFSYDVAFSDESAGDEKDVLFANLQISGGADQNNYELQTADGVATADIARRELTITADGHSITYGENDPALSYQITAGELVTGDQLSGALERGTGQDVGTYTIQQGDLTAGSNYDLSFVSGDLEITPRELTIVVDADQSKTYGENDLSFTFEAENFGWSDDESVLSGELARDAGEDVGSYTIGQGDLDAGRNYTFDFTGADFEITAKELIVNVDADQSKTYGDAEPDVFTFTASNFADGDDESVLSGALARVTGEDAGNYAITAGDLSAGDNYQLSFTGSEFEILPAELTISAADDQSKTYGEGDPAFAWSAEGFQFSDDEQVVSGELDRESGEETGQYELTVGSLDAGDNYTISYTPATFAITLATLLVMAEDGQWKFEGEADPALTFTASGFASGDDESLIEGAAERESGESPGEYAIQKGTLSAGSNYEIDFAGADFAILRTPPVVEHHAPGEDEERIAVDASITAEFDHEITIADAERITLRDAVGDATDLTVSVDGSTLTLTHGGLAHHTDYTVSIGEGAVENIDEIGNQAAQWSFTTIMSFPIAESVSPEDGAELVGVNDSLTVEFSQEISITDASGIAIVSEAGGSPADISAELVSNALRITHSGLENLTEYTITIPAGAVQNVDGVGNELISWSFTTIIASPAKIVLGSPDESEGSIEYGTEFTWETDPNSASYQIQISESDDFSGSPLIDENSTENRYSLLDITEAYTEYFWRVRGENIGAEGDWSDVRSFVTRANRPEPAFPLMNAENISTAPLLRWNSEYVQSEFRVQLSEQEEFNSLVKDTLITGRMITLTGLQADQKYHWRARVEDEVTTSDWSINSDFRTRPEPASQDSEPVEIVITFGRGASGGSGSGEDTGNGNDTKVEDTDYRLIGLPGIDQVRLDELFDGEYKKQWRAFYDTGKDDFYFDEYDPEDDRFVFAPGRGFWVLSTSVLEAALELTSAAPDNQDAFDIPVHAGWNIIANPHKQAVSWAEVQEFNEMSADLYDYEQQFILADTLKPFHGYYFYNHPDYPMDELSIPYASFDQRGRNDESNFSRQPESETRVRVTASFGENTRAQVELLYPDLDSSQSDTRYRSHHPSLENTRYGMMLSDDNSERGGLRRDKAIYSEMGKEYELQMKARVGSSFTMNAELSGLPEQAHVLLVNPVSLQSFLLADGEVEEVKVSEPNTTYQMFVGDQAYLEEIQQSLRPKEFELSPNYPNPFNPVTNIRYSLPEQQHVRLEVYDVIGRRVQVLTNDVQQAGWHVVQFDGSRLASGVYLYRLTTDNNVKVRKMTLVK